MSTIGIIANPVSARDIRRVVANAGNLQISDRANIVLRVLSAAAACGVTRALVMPDRGGIRAHLQRSLSRHWPPGHFPQVEFLDMDTSSTVADSFAATRLLCATGAPVIVVLGGDGTHRAVVRECGAVPIAGISTGTNNAFPEMREPTITGIAAGLFASGSIAAADALRPNKLLEIEIDHRDGRVTSDIAIVDAVVTHDRIVGARALWKTEGLACACLAFADPQSVGLSAIGGLLEPVGRLDAGGLAIDMAADDAHAQVTLRVPIAPGLIRPVRIASWRRLVADEPYPVALSAGTVALDGERELAFEPGDRVRITLRERAFFTLDVARCMALAARNGLLRFPAVLH